MKHKTHDGSLVSSRARQVTVTTVLGPSLYSLVRRLPFVGFFFRRVDFLFMVLVLRRIGRFPFDYTVFTTTVPAFSVLFFCFASFCLFHSFYFLLQLLLLFIPPRYRRKKKKRTDIS